jgi:predicted aspartyl protease
MASVWRGALTVAAVVIACVGSVACDARSSAGKATAAADRASRNVHFEMLGVGGSAIVVPAQINGTRVELVLDTGATFTCVDEKLATELGLPRERGIAASGIGVGGAGAVGLVRVDSLRVGGAIVKALTACTLDLGQLQRIRPGVRGLLGLNFIRNYRLTIDFERQIAQFADPTAKGL